MARVSTLFAIVLVLCIGTSIATKVTSKMAQNLLMVQMSTGYVVDDVLNLLSSFRNDITAQLSDLDGAVEAEAAYLLTVIKGYKEQLDGQDAVCNKIKASQQELFDSYDHQKELLTWITHRIADDQFKIEEYNKQSCQATLSFVEFLRNSQTTLSFIKFLRQAVQNYSFTQMGTIAIVLKKYSDHPDFMTSTDVLHQMLLELNKTVEIDASQFHVGDSLDQDVHGRTSDEIGNGHVDNGKDDLQLEGFHTARNRGLESVKDDLQSLLDDLESKVQASINQRINDQIALSETTSDYILLMELEIIQLQRELVTQVESFNTLEAQVGEAHAVIVACVAEKDDITFKINDTQAKHDAYLSDRDAYRSILLSQLDQINAIIDIYEVKVYNITTEAAKERLDDLIDNQTVDYSAHSDDRSLTVQYDAIQTPELLEQQAEKSILIPSAVDQSDE